MKKEVTIVPKDKCPLDVLAELGERTEETWIFLHQNAVEKLYAIADDYHYRQVRGFQEFFWKGTDDFSETTIQIEAHPEKIWLEVYRIDADDIAFHFPSDDPDDILFLKMDE